ncbi:uncharacterized protein LOC122717130 [Apis laboriosa]|uniref:uncharacterized protein LOC122717130 n=1 Tax=Apis laboriosa TaxID=183418 RepID=UPI001CC57788|nr:uncharacterized protein LOC122717130 [Apis laboriosa]
MNIDRVKASENQHHGFLITYIGGEASIGWMVRTVGEKAINLTGERRVDRIWGDVIRYLVLVDWLMIVATIVRRPGWSTIQLFHESRCVVARFSHRRRIPATRTSNASSFANTNQRKLAKSPMSSLMVEICS